MKITVLIDNQTLIDRYFQAEPALSYLIEVDGSSILFDTGYSGLFADNAKKMDIDLRKIGIVVLSHGHNDHTGGLRRLAELSQKIMVVAHPDVDKPKTYRNEAVGSPMRLSDLPDHFSLRLSREPYAISDHLLFLGEIPRRYPFEGQWLETDPLWDDTALVYHNGPEAFIITGCSHSGICNICEYAKDLLNIERIRGILGGFHLLSDHQKVKNTCSYFRQNPIDAIYPAHCTDLHAKIALAEVASIHEIGVGSILQIQ